MNKNKILGVSFGILFTAMGMVGFARDNVKVRVNGEYLNCEEPAQIIDGRTMLPLRAVFEAIGVTVDYDSVTRKITATDGERIVCLTVGSNVMTVNGETKKLDVPAQLSDNRTLVPLRACSESFDMTVEWDENTRTVDISEKAKFKYEYDQNGNVIYWEESDGDWVKCKYDVNGNMIYKEDSNGVYSNMKYDVNNNLVYREFNDGSWMKWQYDVNNNLIRADFSDGLWIKWEYDGMGNVVYAENSVGRFSKYTYDENGNLLYEEGNGFFTLDEQRGEVGLV